VLRLLGWAALGLLLLLGGLALALVWGVAGGGFGSVEHAGAVRPVPVAPGVVIQRAERQRSARQDLGGAGPAAAPGEQILFGDLHVHTTFSNDAFLFSLPLIQGEGAHPPADACDFARFCADLDFWSITDHAELITPRQWAETRESIRQCNAVAGDAANPDLVAFLGWEWTNMSLERERHFGHKNVILRDVEEGAVPARPIGTGLGLLSQLVIGQGLGQRIVPALLEFPGWERYLDFNRYVAEARAVETCPEGIDTRELPEDCREYAGTPEALFEKLAQWGLPALVIPHGLSWGIHAPPGAELDLQLTRARHDPARQRLLEVYSGHGASELYRPWRSAVVDASEAARCPEPSEGFTPCCWRAGELIRARCGDADADVCEVRVERARRAFLDASIDPVRFQIVPGATPEEWGGCGQLLDGFLPAFNYRPKMSAQYALALGGFGEGEEEPLRFRFGLISSSDNHYARAGTGYKEFSRPGMTDARAISNEFFAKLGEVPVRERTPEPASLEALRANRGLDSLPRAERGASFFYTGGLAALHARGRDRAAIWSALQERRVYATSGDRILLWFDLVNGPDGPLPMGSEVSLAQMPRFAVRVVGALEQLPGCPEHAVAGLTPERVARLCKGECYHPGERRRAIRRIEVVRIRPQLRRDEPVQARIEDPWRTFACPPDPAGCSVAFQDPDFVGGARETVYYVRALQEPTPAVNGAQLRCTYDAQGRCVDVRPCYASGPDQATDDCLAPVEERAWSSPIFLSPVPTRPE
jgi:hypothetical protein